MLSLDKMAIRSGGGTGDTATDRSVGSGVYAGGDAARCWPLLAVR